jgi:hypothetical protein
VDRLATWTIARKLPGEGRVGAGKPPVEVVVEPIEVDIGADRHRDPLTESSVMRILSFAQRKSTGLLGRGQSPPVRGWYGWGC